MSIPARPGATIALLLIFTGCSGERAGDRPPSPLDQQLTVSLRANGCATCHAIDHKTAGPSMVDIAQRHGSNSAAAIAVAVQSGSQNRWGSGRMAPQPGVTKEEAEKLGALVTQLAGAKR